jgi:hypothetical protein
MRVSEFYTQTDPLCFIGRRLSEIDKAALVKPETQQNNNPKKKKQPKRLSEYGDIFL